MSEPDVSAADLAEKKLAEPPGKLHMWLAIVLAVVVTLAVLVACAYLWVFIYSLAISPGGDQAFYEAYAQKASPVVAVVLSFPVFWLMGRYMRRFADKALFAALAVVGLQVVLDVLAVSTMAQDLTFNITMSALSAAAKFAGAYVGAKR